MTNILDIDSLVSEARKNGNKVELQVYQNIKAKKLELKTAKNAKEYTIDVEISMLQKMHKELLEDLATAQAADRFNLIEEAQNQINVIEKLLPAPVSADDIKSEVQKWIDANGAIEKKNQGLCIKAVKSALSGADGKLVSEIVRSYL